MAARSESLGDPAALLDVVTAMVRELRRAAAGSDAANVGLSLTEFRVLKRLSTGMRRVRDVANDLDVTVPTISVVVDSLASRGLVRRCDPEGDRRSVPLVVTDEGQRVLDSACNRQYQVLENLLATLDPADRESVMRALAVLSRALLRH